MPYDDPKLVAKVRRVIDRAYGLDPEDDAWEVAQDILSEIDASGTHVVVPRQATAAMQSALEDFVDYGGAEQLGQGWSRLLDAYLAERQGDGR